MCISVSVCVSCTFSSTLFSCLFILLYPGLFIFNFIVIIMIIIQMLVCFLMRERERKGGDLDLKRRGDRGRENVISLAIREMQIKTT